MNIKHASACAWKFSFFSFFSFEQVALKVSREYIWQDFDAKEKIRF
jgi:hypothetical protein